MAEDQIVKIYRFEEIGFNDIIQKLDAVNAGWAKIAKTKREADKAYREAKVTFKEDSDELKAAKKAQEDATIALMNATAEKKKATAEAKAAQTIRQLEINQQKAKIEGNNIEAGSYSAIARAQKELYSLIKPANVNSIISFQGQDLSFDQAIIKFKELSASEQAFRRQFQQDGTLVGEYTTGIIQAFKKMGLGDLVGGQITQAQARLKELNASFETLKQELSEVRVSGNGSLEGLERQLLANRQEANALTKTIASMSTEFRGAGDIGNQITTSIANGFKNAKGQIAQLVLSYVGFQAAFQAIISGTQKAISLNAELSDSTVDLGRNLEISKEGAAGLVDELKKLDTRTSITDLLDTANIAAKAGVAKENIIGVVTAVDRLKLVFGDSLGNTDALTTSLIKLNNVFGEAGTVSEDALTRTGNAIVELDKAGTASADFLTDYASRVGSIAKAVGLSLPAVLGLGAGFEELGQTAEVSGTATIQIFNKIGADTEKFAKIAGKPLEEFKKLLVEAPQEAFIAVAEGLSKNKAAFEDFAKGLSAAGIDGTRVAGVFTALGTNADFFRSKITVANTAISDTSSILASAADKNQTFAATLDKISKQFQDIASNKNFQNFLVGAANATLALIKALTAIPFGLVLAGIGLLIANTLRLQASKLLLLSATLLENGAKALSIVFDYRDAVAKGIATAATSALTFAKALLTGQITLATAATTIFNAALTVLSGPIGIVVRSIALLAGAFLLMSNRSKESSDALAKNVQAQKEKEAQDRNSIEIAKRVNEATEDQISKLKILTIVAQDNNLKLEVRQKALDEVKKASDGYLNNLTLENLATAEGTKLLEDYIAKLKDTAKAKAINDLASEKEKRALELSTKLASLEQQFNVKDETGGSAFLKNVASRIGLGSGTVGQKIRDLNTQIEENNSELKNLYGQVTTNLKTGQTTVDQIIGAVTGDDGKKTKASRLTNEQKDRFKNIDADRDRLISAAKLERAELNKQYGFRVDDEVDFLTRIQIINETATNRKLAIVKGKNAEENKVRADLNLEKINQEEDTNSKIFDLRQKQFKNELDQAIKNAQAENKAVQENPVATNQERAQAKIDEDQAILNAQLIYASRLDSLEKDLGAKSLKNAQESADEILKTQEELNKHRLALTQATIDDIAREGAERIAALKLEVSKARLAIAEDTKTSSGKKVTQNEVLDKAEDVGTLSIQVETLKRQMPLYRKQLENKKITQETYLKYETELNEKAKALGDKTVEDLKSQNNQIKTIGELLQSSLGKLFNVKAGSKTDQAIGQIVSQSFSLAADAMNGYFDAERARIEQSLKLTEERIESDRKLALSRAQSRAEEESLNEQFDIKKQQAEREAFERTKKIKKAEVEIAFATEIANIFSTAYQLGPIAGPIVGGVLAGLAVARLALNLSRIDKEMFAIGGNIDSTSIRGGRVKGRPHSQGGNDFMFRGRVYNDEVDELSIIRTKGVPGNKSYTISGTHTQIASKLNQIGGGIAFAPGATLKKFDWGGDLGMSLQAPIFEPSSSRSSADSKLMEVLQEQNKTIQEQAVLLQEQAKAIQATSQRVDVLKVVQVTQEITEAQKAQAKQSRIGNF